MQILLVGFFWCFFFPFPTPFFWRQVDISAGAGHPDNSVSQQTGEVTRAKHCVTVPPTCIWDQPGIHSVFSSLPSFQWSGLTRILVTTPTVTRQCILPSLLEAATCSILHSLTGSSPTTLFPGGERVRCWDCPRPVSTCGEKHIQCVAYVKVLLEILWILEVHWRLFPKQYNLGAFPLTQSICKSAATYILSLI